MASYLGTGNIREHGLIIRRVFGEYGYTAFEEYLFDGLEGMFKMLRGMRKRKKFNPIVVEAAVVVVGAITLIVDAAADAPVFVAEDGNYMYLYSG